jgi:3-oxoacyl-[acyl-carrier protein] reductase
MRDLKVGEAHTLTIAVTEALVDKFAELTGDYNPLHMDSAFARNTPFKERVVHGMLSGVFVSTIIGMHLPGPGSLWLSQDYEFIVPVRIGDVLSIRAEVVRTSDQQGIIFLGVEARNQKGILVLRGGGKVKIAREENVMNNKLIKDCRVLVTGASRGLGAAIALKFAGEGAEVFVNYRASKEKALELQAQAQGLPGKIVLVEGDVACAEGVEALLAQLKGQTVDIVVFNALSGLKQAPLLDQKMEDFERAIDFGMRSPVRLLHALLPGMVTQKFGRIVSILSTYGCGAPPAGFSSYVVNKSALEAISKSVAVEYGKHNICANMVSPSMMRTDLTADTPERAKQLIEVQSPLKRLPGVDEVAANVVYLCSPAASYINGHNLILSGGGTIV